MGLLFYAALLIFAAPALGCHAPTSSVPIQPPSTREDTRLEAGIRRIMSRGRDGTLAEVQRESPAAGHVFAKTGTNGGYDPLNQRTVVSKALAGYLTTAAGRRLAFAIYARDIPIENWTKLSWVSEALGEIATIAYATVDELR